MTLDMYQPHPSIISLSLTKAESIGTTKSVQVGLTRSQRHSITVFMEPFLLQLGLQSYSSWSSSRAKLMRWWTDSIKSPTHLKKTHSAAIRSQRLDRRSK
ncbi:hypothetical protein CFBP6411_00485 [Pseudomonas syringae group genomosp. 3]|uniref:Uncharacterized protein n=1 Tax=Pseudomonas syringae group genomosp. 3 TaxID=251701 RepID=A0A2K4W7I3_9PSED|nr:hypothetical protein CFBP6411_00485 [Pseudomonas syringae group genomosp. 3]